MTDNTHDTGRQDAEKSGSKPITTGGNQYEAMEVTINRSGMSDQWGLLISDGEHQEGGLGYTVLEITDGDAVHQWNEQNQSIAIRPGDVIFTVNGKAATQDIMLELGNSLRIAVAVKKEIPTNKNAALVDPKTPGSDDRLLFDHPPPDTAMPTVPEQVVSIFIFVVLVGSGVTFSAFLTALCPPSEIPGGTVATGVLLECICCLIGSPFGFMIGSVARWEKWSPHLGVRFLIIQLSTVIVPHALLTILFHNKLPGTWPVLVINVLIPLGYYANFVSGALLFFFIADMVGAKNPWNIKEYKQAVVDMGLLQVAKVAMIFALALGSQVITVGWASIDMAFIAPGTWGWAMRWLRSPLLSFFKSGSLMIVCRIMPNAFSYHAEGKGWRTWMMLHNHFVAAAVSVILGIQTQTWGEAIFFIVFMDIALFGKFASFYYGERRKKTEEGKGSPPKKGLGALMAVPQASNVDTAVRFYWETMVASQMQSAIFIGVVACWPLLQVLPDKTLWTFLFPAGEKSLLISIAFFGHDFLTDLVIRAVCYNQIGKAKYDLLQYNMFSKPLTGHRRMSIYCSVAGLWVVWRLLTVAWYLRAANLAMFQHSDPEGYIHVAKTIF